MSYTKEEIIQFIKEQHEKDLESLLDFLERVLPDSNKENEEKNDQDIQVEKKI